MSLQLNVSSRSAKLIVFDEHPFDDFVGFEVNQAEKCGKCTVSTNASRRHEADAVVFHPPQSIRTVVEERR